LAACAGAIQPHAPWLAGQGVLQLRHRQHALERGVDEAFAGRPTGTCAYLMVIDGS